MSAPTLRVIVVENNGKVDEEIYLHANDDYQSVFTNLYRMGYKDDVYSLYEIEGGERHLVESYAYNDR